MTWLIALLLPIAFLLGYGAAARKKNTPASPEPDTQLLQKEAENLRAQLTQSEKMATLGHLTAGIAHEIKNPLNFVINFSRVSQQLLTELKELSAVKRTGTVSQLPGVEVRPGEEESPEDEDIREIIDDLERNITKINAHGHSIDGIVKSMLLHSRGRKGKLRPVDLNALLGENTNLVYHGMRALNPGFSVVIRRDFDRNIGMVPVVPRDFSRAYVNILTNACMAAAEKKESASSGFSPLVTVTTEKKTETIDI
ncbi:MAG: hypothetical protein GY765_20200, partial [bacterium]|nr:hypothetical protein [bacterium]